MTRDSTASPNHWKRWLVIGIAQAAFFAWELATSDGPAPWWSFVAGWMSGGFITMAWYERRLHVRSVAEETA